jgi:hypothetical protein
MKTLALLAVALLASCATVVTTNTLPDGTTVTVTSKSADPVAIKAALDMANLIAPIVADRANDQAVPK